MSEQSTEYTPSFTKANITALEQSIAKGVKKVKYSDKEIEYRSLTEMIKLLNYMKKACGIKKCGNGLFGGKAKTPIFDKGLDDC